MALVGIEGLIKDMYEGIYEDVGEEIYLKKYFIDKDEEYKVDTKLEGLDDESIEIIRDIEEGKEVD